MKVYQLTYLAENNNKNKTRPSVDGQFALDESLEIEMSQAGPPREIMQDCLWGPGTD